MQLDSADWIVLAVKQVKVDTACKCFLKIGFGKDDCSIGFTEASESVMAICNICQDIELTWYKDNIIRFDVYPATYFILKSATSFLLLRNAETEKEKES